MIIAVDFDGTIVEHRYPKIGKEIPFAIQTLRTLIKEGHQLILWSVREGEQRLAGVPGRPAVPVRLLIGQRHTAVLFPEPFLHPGRQVAGADPGAADTVPFEEIERIRHQRPPAQADHGFGHVAGQGAQGFLLPFRQNDRRHQLTHIPKHPFVMRKRNAPHKSNSSAVRRRTASSFPRYP